MRGFAGREEAARAAMHVINLYRFQATTEAHYSALNVNSYFTRSASTSMETVLSWLAVASLFASGGWALNNGLALTPPSTHSSTPTYCAHTRPYCPCTRCHCTNPCILHAQYIVGWMAWERFRCNIDCDLDPYNCIR